jgi:ABC-type lipopolysaccharide export system ATPase subunit
MIGGIGVFLPFSQEEAENLCCRWCNSSRTVTTEMTVKEELEQVVETAQAQEEAGEENEHSEEWLNDFSQGAEKKEAVALKLAAKEAERVAGNLSLHGRWS